jgi:cellulose biosynthesis protein BcsQ
MATFIGFINQKGGVGKSQSTVLLATALANAPFNLRVLVCDTDKQQSISQLRTINNAEYEGVIDPQTGVQAKPPYTVISQTAARFVMDVAQFDEDYDVVFCDVAGKLDNDLPAQQQEITPVLMRLDWCIIPVVGGNHNVNASSEFLNFAVKVAEFRAESLRPLSIAVFPNMEKSKGFTDDLHNELNAMSQQMPQVRFMTHGLKDYAKLAKADTYVSEYKPNSTATANVKFTNWVDEIYDMCGISEEVEA